jgi:Zn-dependent protease with chaperone function
MSNREVFNLVPPGQFDHCHTFRNELIMNSPQYLFLFFLALSIFYKIKGRGGGENKIFKILMILAVFFGLLTLFSYWFFGGSFSLWRQMYCM